MRALRLLLLAFLFLFASGFSAHKFYVSIYQLRHNPDKKRLEITARVFQDDLNGCVSKFAKTETHIGAKEQTQADLDHLKRYFEARFQVRIDGKDRPMTLLRCEMEENTVLCYFRIDGVARPKTLGVVNRSLLDCHDDQQNIIQAEVGGVKKNLLLKTGETSGVLDFR